MNTKFFATALGAALLAGLVTATPVMAARPPVGFTIFCTNNAAHCAPDKVGQVAMSDQLIAALVKVNASVNNSMRYRAERGPFDVWKIGGSTGDCEDYVLTKRAKLIQMGVPAGALRIATTHTRRGEPHAILVVKTSEGDYVLDNIQKRVLLRAETGYNLRTMSSKNPLVWTAG